MTHVTFSEQPADWPTHVRTPPHTCIPSGPVVVSNKWGLMVAARGSQKPVGLLCGWPICGVMALV